MRKELFIHFAFWFSYFVVVCLVKHYFNFFYWPFILGGLVGVVLPDLDHLLYFYVVKPEEFTSQREKYLLEKHQIVRSVDLLYETRNERKGLIFHTILFQLIFFVVLFWILSSSGSLLGKGLALSFMFHLSIDQLIDLNNLQSLDNWFTYLPYKLTYYQAKIYWIISTTFVIILSFLL